MTFPSVLAIAIQPCTSNGKRIEPGKPFETTQQRLDSYIQVGAARLATDEDFPIDSTSISKRLEIETPSIFVGASVVENPLEIETIESTLEGDE